MTRVSPKLSPLVYLPERDALISFLFQDMSEDPLLTHGDNWCVWRRTSHTDTSGQDSSFIPKGKQVQIAISPGATHIAAAFGSRLAILGTKPMGGRHNSPVTQICTAVPCDTADNCSEGEHVTAITWVGFTPPSFGEVIGELENDAILARELYVVVGTSSGTILIYTPTAICLISQKLNQTQTYEGATIFALHARICQHPSSEVNCLEHLAIVLNDRLFRIDAVEFRLMTRRATFSGQSAAESLSDYPLTKISWDLSKLVPVVDAACLGRQLPSLSQTALSSQRHAIVPKLTQGLLTAGIWDDSRRIFGIVSFLVSMKNRDSALGAATAFAKKAASSAVATVSTIFGGAVDVAGVVANSVPNSRTFKGAVVGAMSTASNAMESAAVGMFGSCTSNKATFEGTILQEHFKHNNSNRNQSAMKCSAFVDPPRCVLGIYPAPRGNLCAIVDSLGRVILLDTSSSFLITTVSVLKGCRDVELSWVDVPPSAADDAKFRRSIAGMGRLCLALRSPHRNQGRVETWEIGRCGNMCVELTPNSRRMKSEAIVESKLLDFRKVKLLQGPPLFGAFRSASVGSHAFTGSKSYVLSSDGRIHEITFTK